jgi:hypothetical protein
MVGDSLFEEAVQGIILSETRAPFNHAAPARR